MGNAQICGPHIEHGGVVGHGEDRGAITPVQQGRTAAGRGGHHHRLHIPPPKGTRRGDRPIALGHKTGGAAEVGQHTGQEGVAQLFSGGAGRNIDRVDAGGQGRGMGTGHPKGTHHQMANHRFGPANRINTLPLTIGQIEEAVICAAVLGEAGDHGDRRRALGLDRVLGRPQQTIRLGHAPPGGPRTGQVQGHAEGAIGQDRIGDRQPPGRPRRVNHLQMPPPQFRLNALIQNHPNPLVMHGQQPPIPSGKAIQAKPFHIQRVGDRPGELGPVEHIGMGDQHIGNGGDRPGHGQRIPGIAPDRRPNPRRHQQRRHKRRSHPGIPAHRRSSIIGTAAPIQAINLMSMVA